MRIFEKFDFFLEMIIYRSSEFETRQKEIVTKRTIPLFPPSFREEKKKKKIRPSQEDGLFLPVTRGPRVSYVSINLLVQRRRR